MSTLAVITQLVEAMEIQQMRDSGEFHLSAPAFAPIWDGALSAGRAEIARLTEIEQPEQLVHQTACADEASTTLLPCPFCGATPKLETRDVEPQNDPWYGKKLETFVLCDCGACLFDGAFHEGFWDADTRALEAWNRRVVGASPGAKQPNEQDPGSAFSATGDKQ